MSDTIDISGLNKGAVLAVLYNASAPQGMGFLQAGNGPTEMTVEQGEALIKQSTYFDYLYGRPLKSNLEGDQFSPGGFDRDNGGPGTAARLIEELRSTSEVVSDGIREHHEGLMGTKAHEAMAMANTTSSFTPADPATGRIATFELGADDVGEYLEKAVDAALIREAIG